MEKPKWPSDGSCVPASLLLRPVMEAIRNTHHIEYVGGEANYDGFDIGQRELVGSFSPYELTHRQLDKLDDRPLDRWLLVAYQLGVEQGRRDERHSQEDWKFLYESLKDRTKVQIEDLTRTTEETLRQWKTATGCDSPEQVTSTRTRAVPRRFTGHSCDTPGCASCGNPGDLYDDLQPHQHTEDCSERCTALYDGPIDQEA